MTESAGNLEAGLLRIKAEERLSEGPAVLNGCE